jgi:hypothetical protein
MKAFQWFKSITTTLLLCSMVASIGVVGAGFLANKSRSIAGQTLPSLVHLAMANQCRGQAFLHLISALNADDDTEFQQQKEKVRFFSECSQNALESYGRFIGTAENRQLFDNFMDERDHYIKTRDSILLLGEQGDREKAMKELIEQLLPMYERYLDNGQKLVEYVSREGVKRADVISLVSRWTQVFAFVSSALIFIFGFFLGYTR